MSFNKFNLNNKLNEGIDAFNYEEPTQIQAVVIPEIIAGNDILACSQTGSGKTAAFLIPIIEQILTNPKKGIRALVITPTREICMQVEEQVAGLGYFTGTSAIAVYGGNDQDGFTRQKSALTKGADIVVATPGRLKSHQSLGYVDFSNLDYLVLDEADEMLDMGFYHDIMAIIEKVPAKRQTLLFSATMPVLIKKLAEEILSNPIIIDINLSKPAVEIDQKAYLVYSERKFYLLKHILSQKPKDKIIVFVSTKVAVSKLATLLRQHKQNILYINSSFTQQERTETVRKFKTADASVLITTNLLSRGIDIDDVNLIINYDIPEKPEDYVHRIGRTARAGKEGMAISLINETEIDSFMRIEKHVNKIVEKLDLPDDFGTPPKYERSFGKKKRYFKQNNKTHFKPKKKE